MTRLKHFLPYRIGIGFDAHLLTKQRQLILGGVIIPYRFGLKGHSDADVLTHAIIDAILGAMAMPDIGTLFPDTEPNYKDAYSLELLNTVINSVRKTGWQPVQIDCVITADEPLLHSHIPAIRKKLALTLKIPQDVIGLKAKTTEGTRVALPKKSISAIAVVLLGRRMNR